MRVYLTPKKCSEPRSKSDVKTDVFDFNENNSKISSTLQSCSESNLISSSASTSTLRGIENNDSSTQSQMKSLQPARSDDDCSCQLHSPVLTDCVHESNLPSTCLIPAPGELCGACDLAESNAMDKCQICGLPNQYGESFDKNVDHLTSPVGRCVCDFTGIKNSNKALSNTINIEMKLTSCSHPMSSGRLTGHVPKSTSSSLRVSELNKSSVKQFRHC